MPHPITSIERIHLEARQAATRYSDVNAACPYPWGSGAAIEFKRAFEAAREQQLDAIAQSGHAQPGAGTTHHHPV